MLTVRRWKLIVPVAIVLTSISLLFRVVYQAKSRRAAIVAVQQLGGMVDYQDWGRLDALRCWIESVVHVDLRKVNSVDFISKGRCIEIHGSNLNCLRRLGEIRRLSFTSVLLTDDALISLEELHGLEELYFFYTNIGDTDLAHVRNLKRLRELCLARSDVTDVGLRYVAGLPSIQRLILSRSRHISDEGIECLECADTLEEVVLSSTGISDAAIMHLKKLSNLRRLDVNATQVSDDILRKLACLRNIEYIVCASGVTILGCHGQK
jgi:hypothetical protein